MSNFAFPHVDHPSPDVVKGFKKKEVLVNDKAMTAYYSPPEGVKPFEIEYWQAVESKILESLTEQCERVFGSGMLQQLGPSSFRWIVSQKPVEVCAPDNE